MVVFDYTGKVTRKDTIQNERLRKTTKASLPQPTQAYSRETL